MGDGAPSFLCPFSWATMPPQLAARRAARAPAAGRGGVAGGGLGGVDCQASGGTSGRRTVRRRRRVLPDFVAVLRRLDGLHSVSERGLGRGLEQEKGRGGGEVGLPKAWPALRAEEGRGRVRPVYHGNPLTVIAGDDVHFDDRDALARTCCDWCSIPREMDVAQRRGSDGADTLPGTLPPDRVERKRQQVRNMVVFAAPLIRDGIRHRRQEYSLQKERRQQQSDNGRGRHEEENAAAFRKFTVVDFCCGSGWQSLPLAFAFPDAAFVLIDCKARSLDVARERAARAGLRNVRTLLLSIERFHEPFDLGLALHACGQASDISMEKCVRAGAAFVVAPCCVGKVQSRAAYTTVDDSRPRRRGVRMAGAVGRAAGAARVAAPGVTAPRAAAAAAKAMPEEALARERVTLDLHNHDGSVVPRLTFTRARPAQCGEEDGGRCGGGAPPDLVVQLQANGAEILRDSSPPTLDFDLAAGGGGEEAGAAVFLVYCKEYSEQEQQQSGSTGFHRGFSLCTFFEKFGRDGSNILPPLAPESLATELQHFLTEETRAVLLKNAEKGTSTVGREEEEEEEVVGKGSAEATPTGRPPQRDRRQRLAAEEDAPLAYPRSVLMRAILSRRQYDAVAKAADFGHGGYDKGAPTSVRPKKVKWADERRSAKSIVEWDRGMFARERGYRVYLSRMEPPSCTPKNDVLVGWPEERLGRDDEGHDGTNSRNSGKISRSYRHLLAKAMESMGVAHYGQDDVGLDTTSTPAMKT